MRHCLTAFLASESPISPSQTACRPPGVLVATDWLLAGLWAVGFMTPAIRGASPGSSTCRSHWGGNEQCLKQISTFHG